MGRQLAAATGKNNKVDLASGGVLTLYEAKSSGKINIASYGKKPLSRLREGFCIVIANNYPMTNQL